MKNIIAIIPARLHSKRLKEKILRNIEGKTMIQRVYEQCLKAKLINNIYISTDNIKSFKHCKTFCNNTILSSTKHSNGTERLAETVKNINCDNIINIQADLPLIKASLINKIITYIQNNNYNTISAIAKIKDTKLIQNPNCVKVTINKNNYALYFSRSPIPYQNNNTTKNNKTTFFAHIGIYAYNKNFLMTYPKLQKGYYEKIENLEQLRILENGYKIKMIKTNHIPKSVDCEKDLNNVKDIYKRYNSLLSFYNNYYNQKL